MLFFNSKTLVVLRIEETTRWTFPLSICINFMLQIRYMVDRKMQCPTEKYDIHWSQSRRACVRIRREKYPK